MNTTAPQPTSGQINGQRGTAVPMPVPPVPRLATLLTHWLITASGYHPTRTQWVLAVDSLMSAPGLEDPRITEPGATHAVIVMPLDAGHEPLTPHGVVRLLLARALPTVATDAITVQVQAAHDEVRNLVPLLAAAVLNQDWSPDASVEPGQVRGAWIEGIARQLHDWRGRQPATEPITRVGTPPNGVRTTALLGPPMTPPGGNRR